MKKIISILMVLAMVLTLLTVGITSTSAADTATVTIYGLDGTTEVKDFNVGDEFTVYTTLNVSASVTDGKVASVQGTQTYTPSVLSLVDEVSGQYGEFVDPVKVFPVTGDATMANGAQEGKIAYNASNPTTGFTFDSASSQLIVTTYKVNAAGTAEVKNAIKNLAAADASLTRIVFEGQTQEGKSYTGKATFIDPTPTIDHAEVRIHSLDGSVETQSFNIGDTFNVYTCLDASSVNDGKMSSINGVQRYTSSVLQLADTVLEDGSVYDTAKVFPVMGDSAMGNAKNAGTVKFVGSSTSGFLFNSLNSQLIVTTYRVTANGYADITNKLNILAAADEDITRIVFNGETQSGMSYNLRGSFTTDGPIPTLPPQPPTEPETQPATQPVGDKLKVTIVNPDNTTVVKEFSKNETFTVYTVLNAGTTIASVDGTQTYPTASLQLTDSVTGEYNEIANKTAVFPILGDEAVAAVNNGTIKFNATRGTVNSGYAFNSATSKLIVTNYKVLATGEATIKTTLKTLIKDDSAATKIVFNGATQSGQSYSMPGSFTDPGAPAPTEPTPTEPTPTEPTPTEPTPTEPTPTDKAVVTIYGIDGSSKTKTFNIGDKFTVYTTLDASQVLGQGYHGIASISATQTFTESVLKSTDEVDELYAVVDTAAMFPNLGASATSKIFEGLNRYNASTPGVNKGFVFDDAEDLLAVTNYEVIAAGNAEVRNALNTVAVDNSALTVVVNKGVVKPGYEIGGIVSFWDPSQPEPTEPAPTEPPTEPAPTEPDQQATVIIYGIDGTSETKKFNVGEEFTVYTTFDASQYASTGIASIGATQTFTDSILQSVDQVDSDKVVVDNNAMFPILKDSAMAKIDDGVNTYNASTPTVGKGFQFGSENNLLIVTKYKATSAGTAYIRNTLTTVAAADNNLTRLVDKGVKQPGVVIGGKATFTDPTNPVVPTQPAEKYLLGDADNNNKVNSVDVTTIQRIRASMAVEVDTTIAKRNGDVDRNGKFEIIDATLIQRYLAHMDVAYPIGQYVEVQ